MSTVIAWLAVHSAVCIALWAAALALRPHGWVGIAGVGFVVSLCLGPVTVLTWLLCGIAAGVVMARKWTFWPAMAAVTLVALVPAGYRAWSWSGRIAELEALRAQYPVQRLEDRLAILRSPSIVVDGPLSALQPANGSPVVHTFSEPELADIEAEYNGYRNYRREGMLRSLTDVHGAVEREFHRREGFGVVRSLNMWPRQEVLELPEPEPMPQPLLSSDAGSLPLAAGFDPPRPPHLGDLQGLHRQGQLSFIDPQSLGYVDRTQHGPQAVGFQAHGFRTRPELERNQPWRVTEVELVSLLKDTSPAVYQSDRLPNLKHVAHDDVPLRPLDEFEQSALERLHHGEDVVIDQHPAEIRVLGSLRAIRQCLDCHSVERGTLLGAFTYRLRPVVPATAVDSPTL